MKGEMMDIEVLEVARHRNGVCGLGFHVVLFRWTPEDLDEPEQFLATVFDEPGACAVIGLDRIADMGVLFAGGNSWRGDRFEGVLRRAIQYRA